MTTVTFEVSRKIGPGHSYLPAPPLPSQNNSLHDIGSLICLDSKFCSEGEGKVINFPRAACVAFHCSYLPPNCHTNHFPTATAGLFVPLLLLPSLPLSPVSRFLLFCGWMPIFELCRPSPLSCWIHITNAGITNAINTTCVLVWSDCIFGREQCASETDPWLRCHRGDFTAITLTPPCPLGFQLGRRNIHMDSMLY